MQPTFAELLAQNKQEIVEDLTREVKERAGPTYATMPIEKLQPRMGLVLDAVQQSVEQGNPAILGDFVSDMVRQRAMERYALGEIQEVIFLLRTIVQRLVNHALQEDLDGRLVATQQFEELSHWAYRRSVEVYLNAYEERMELQRRALAELSTPVVQVYENVLVLPLVGAIDTERARRVMEELLEGIMRYQAELVIIDITGVPVVDTAVANHLMQTIKSARLLGTQSILVGISSEIAQTLVHLQVDLTAVVTRSNLQAGIEYALEQMGLEIAPKGEGTADDEGENEPPPEPRLQRA